MELPWIQKKSRQTCGFEIVPLVSHHFEYSRLAFLELPNQKGGVAREINEHDFGVNKASNASPPTNRTSQAELWLVADKHFPPMFLPNKQHTAESFLDAVVAFNLDQARVKLLCFLALFMRILGVLCLSVHSGTLNH